jgi:hypothetical protein
LNAMMLAARARPSVQRLDGNRSICILPKAAMNPAPEAGRQRL